MEEVEIYEALIGFFLTMLITMMKNYLLKKKSSSDVLIVGVIGWASHFAIRKILKRKYQNK